MKPLYQFILGFILLIIIIGIGMLGYTDTNNQLPIIPIRIMQYLIAAIAGILMGDAARRRK